MKKQEKIKTLLGVADQDTRVSCNFGAELSEDRQDIENRIEDIDRIAVDKENSDESATLLGLTEDGKEFLYCSKLGSEPVDFDSYFGAKRSVCELCDFYSDNSCIAKKYFNVAQK